MRPLSFESHGGRRALIRQFLYGVAALAGGARVYRHIDFATAQRVVFACKGNICRSPFAEAVARAQGLVALSFGLDAQTGSPANPQAALVASAFGVDLSSHRAVAAKDFAFRTGDLIVAFDPAHLAPLGALIAPTSAAQLTLLGAWLRPPQPYIHDPFGSGPRYFARCFGRIDRGVAVLARHMDRTIAAS